MISFIARKTQNLIRPVQPFLAWYLSLLVLFFLFRAVLCVIYFDQVNRIDHYLLLFPTGARMDTILLSYTLIIPFVLQMLLPGRTALKTRMAFSLFFALLTWLFLFLEIATFPFMAEFSSRPDRLFIEHMTQVREVFSMVLKGYPLHIMAGIILPSAAAWLVFMFFQKRVGRFHNPSVLHRTVLFIIILPLLVMGARSSFRHRPANISTAAFSTSHLVNQLALNSTYSLAYAAYSLKKHENKPSRLYGKMDTAEMFSLVCGEARIPEKAPGAPSLPLFHQQQSRFTSGGPRNLVIILEESLGAEYVGCLGGMQLTPNLDRLSRKGLLLTRLYATGTRTVRGIEALVSGFLPTAGRSVVKLGLSQHNFFTIADLLQRRGYQTEFIYGGESHFDNMRSFFLGNGFQKVYDEKSFDNPVFRGTWGVSDEDLFRKANDVFISHEGRPFFALLLTTSNHDPFEFPEGRIRLHEQPKATRHNAMQYADYALGMFFDRAAQEKYFSNTVFLVIADHSTRLRGQDLIPIHKFHIPGLIIAPGLAPGTYDKVCSQIDIPTTLLDVMGIATDHPMIGRPLLSLPEDVPGRAVMQYGTTNAYMTGSRVIIQRPAMQPVQFNYKSGQLIPAELDSKLAKTALAHTLLPGYLYRKQLYRLPTPSGIPYKPHIFDNQNALSRKVLRKKVGGG